MGIRPKMIPSVIIHENIYQFEKARQKLRLLWSIRPMMIPSVIIHENIYQFEQFEKARQKVRLFWRMNYMIIIKKEGKLERTPHLKTNILFVIMKRFRKRLIIKLNHQFI